MIYRLVWTILTIGICLATAPAGPLHPDGVHEAIPDIEPPVSIGRLPTQAEFVALLHNDPFKAFEAVMQRCQQEIHGYTMVMRKQERIKGKLGPVEEVDVAVREEPFSVYMAWRGSIGLGKPVKTLYVREDNQGLTRVRTKFLTLNIKPDSAESRGAARYSIEDFGFYYTTLRTYRVWKAARDAGRFHYTFVETKPVPECGGRVCHLVRRVCSPPEVDNFGLADKGVIDPSKHPKEALTTVLLAFDAETWQQVGTEQHNADGELVGSYYFRDVKLNPKFGPDQFTPAALSR